MAGTYPDVPGHRFMYDQDGSLLLASPVSAVGPLTPIDATLLNDEDSDSWTTTQNSGQWREIVVVFPEARDISGMFLRIGGTSPTISASYSTDTTDGTDGNWTSFSVSNRGAIVPDFRSSIQPLALPGVRGIKVRITGTNNTWTTAINWHVYGTVPITANTDRLEFWQPAADSILDKAGLDFGDMPLGAVRTKQLRVKNLSTTKTATSVVVSANNLAGGDNDSFVTGLEFSMDGTTWGPSATIDTIAPEGVSPVVSVRRSVLVNELVGLHAARISAIPSAFA